MCHSSPNTHILSAPDGGWQDLKGQDTRPPAKPLLLLPFYSKLHCVQSVPVSLNVTGNVVPLSRNPNREKLKALFLTGRNLATFPGCNHT